MADGSDRAAEADERARTGALLREMLALTEHDADQLAAELDQLAGPGQRSACGAGYVRGRGDRIATACACKAENHNMQGYASRRSTTNW